MKNLYTFIAAFLLLVTVQANAQQVTLMTQDMTVAADEVFEYDVKVENFEVISSVQFAMFWDNSVVEFVGVDNYGLPSVSLNGNFNTMDAANGKLRFNWVDPDPNFMGVTLEDESVIFTLLFKGIGGPGQQTLVEITSDPVFPPMPVEVINTTGEVEVNTQDGTVTMEGVNASYETLTTDFLLMQNSPNPFAETTNITFVMNETSDTELTIYDHAGKTIFAQSKTYQPGEHNVLIDRSLFQGSGSYFYTLKTENATATRQMVVR